MDTHVRRGSGHAWLLRPERALCGSVAEQQVRAPAQAREARAGRNMHQLATRLGTLASGSEVWAEGVNASVMGGGGVWSRGPLGALGV